MATIGITDCDGTPFWLVQCVEPVQKLIPSTPPYPRITLTVAVEMCPDTRMWGVSREHVPIPGDFGDEVYYYALDITEANTLALLASDFAWLPEAEEAAVALSISPVRVDELREEIRSYVESQRQAYLNANREGSEFEANNIFDILYPGAGSPAPDKYRQALQNGIQRFCEQIRARNLVASMDYYVSVLDDPERDKYAKELAAEHLLEIPDLEPDIALRVKKVLGPRRAAALEPSTEWEDLPRWKRGLFGFLFGIGIATFFAGWIVLVDDDVQILKGFLVGTVYLSVPLGLICGLIAAFIDP